MKKFCFFSKGILLVAVIAVSINYIGCIMATVEKKMNLDKAKDCDVVFVGSSHVYLGINPQLVYDETGLTAINLASSSQDIKGSYWMLRSYLSNHSPQVVFVELPARMAGARETYVLWNFKEYDPLKYMAYYDLKNDEFTINDSSRFLAFRTRFDSIDKGDFDFVRGRGEQLSDRWYNAVFVDAKEITRREVDEAYKGDECVSTDTMETTRLYVDKIIKLAYENDAVPIFINTPWVETSGIDRFYTEMNGYFESRGVTFLNFSDLYSDNSDFDLETDFFDDAHLSYEGGCKLTRILCDHMVGSLKLKHDERKPVDSSWERYRNHYMYTYYTRTMHPQSLSEYLEYSNSLPDDYIQLITFDAKGYDNLSQTDKDMLQSYFKSYAGYEDGFCVMIRRGRKSRISQGDQSAELYDNIDGVSCVVKRDADESIIRIGTDVRRQEGTGVQSAIYVQSYNAILRTDEW